MNSAPFRLPMRIRVFWFLCTPAVLRIKVMAFLCGRLGCVLRVRMIEED